MPISFRLDTITLNSGDTIEVPESGTVVIVGPNNAGKSTLLKEMISRLQTGAAATIVNSVSTQTSGTNVEMSQWLSKNFEELAGKKQRTFQVNGSDIREINILSDWRNGAPVTLLNSSALFCYQTTGAQQQSNATNFSSFDVLKNAPATPVQRMYVDEDLESEMSDHFRRAFGIRLFVNRAGGNRIPVHCGDRPLLNAGETCFTRSYLERVNQVPSLSKQGDGMKSFAGAMFTVCANNGFLICFDEPELFLHPPQARELGRFFANHKPAGKQLVIATHNSALIRGLLDVDSSDAKIIRLTRSGNLNHANTLSDDDLEQFWSDPILRYSDALDGIFHEKVFVVESDSDCHFYAAMMNGLAESQDTQMPNVMFVPCGGKHRIKTVVSALRALRVNAHAIVDIDIFDCAKTLQSLIESLGANWDQFSDLHRNVKNSFEQLSPPQNANQVSERIREILDNIETANFERQNERDIRDAMRAVSPWRLAKRTGINHLQGNALVEARQLVSDLKNIGLHVLSIGEIERFVPTIAEHGPAWASAALERDLINDPELQAARDFISRL